MFWWEGIQLLRYFTSCPDWKKNHNWNIQPDIDNNVDRVQVLVLNIWSMYCTAAYWKIPPGGSSHKYSLNFIAFIKKCSCVEILIGFVAKTGIFATLSLEDFLRWLAPQPLYSYISLYMFLLYCSIPSPLHSSVISKCFYLDSHPEKKAAQSACKPPFLIVWFAEKKWMGHFCPNRVKQLIPWPVSIFQVVLASTLLYN